MELRAAATDTSCFGETSIKSIFSLDDNSKLNFFCKQLILQQKIRLYLKLN
jgi:hypothetical protein